MKKILFFAAALSMALVSCNSKSANSETSAADSTEVKAEQTETVAGEVADTATTAAADVVKDLQPSDMPEAAEGKPVVIDFSATWCGPCQNFKPIYHKVAAEMGDKATFYAADLDECKALGEKYNITSIPCIVVLKKGAEPVSKVGYMDESEFKTFLNQSL